MEKEYNYINKEISICISLEGWLVFILLVNCNLSLIVQKTIPVVLVVVIEKVALHQIYTRHSTGTLPTKHVHHT